MALKAFPIESLSSSGLLWRINRTLLQPDGFELREADDGSLSIVGYHDTPRDYSDLEAGAEDAAWRKFRQTLLDAESNNRPERSRATEPDLVMPFKNPTK